MDCPLPSAGPVQPWVGLSVSAGETVHQLQHISYYPVLAFLRHIIFRQLSTSNTELRFCSSLTC